MFISSTVYLVSLRLFKRCLGDVDDCVGWLVVGVNCETDVDDCVGWLVGVNCETDVDDCIGWL